MCYDISAKKRSFKKQAKRLGYSENEIEKIIKQTFLPLYHSSGFSHPVLPLINSNSLNIGTWGLLPHWAKTVDTKLMNRMLNARSETMHEKKSYRPVINNRCIVVVDGFYEHHHYKNKTYPFLISHAENEPICLAALYSNWTDKSTGEVITTFTIITTKGNSLLKKLHNNPELSFGPRMPVILNDSFVSLWLQTDLSKEDTLAMIQPFPSNALQYHTVDRLRGKAYMGNIAAIVEPIKYPELVFNA